MSWQKNLWRRQETDADSLARLAESADRCLGVGYQARFHPALRELRQHVRDGGVGKVAFVRASWQTQYPALPREWRLQRETSGGWSIMDIGTHGLDAAFWLTGFPEARLLAASLSTQHWPVEVDDQALLLLEFDSTRVIVEAATGVRGPTNRVEVYGTEGWAIATGTFVDRLGPAGGTLPRRAGSSARMTQPSIRMKCKPRHLPPGRRVRATWEQRRMREPATSPFWSRRATGCRTKLGLHHLHRPTGRGCERRKA